MLKHWAIVVMSLRDKGLADIPKEAMCESGDSVSEGCFMKCGLQSYGVELQAA
jgi:hypothetical protein